MGFLSNYYNKPGPGVDRDEPRKQGAARFFEILARDFPGLVKLNLLFSLYCLPSFALFVLFILGIGGVLSILFLLLSLAAAFPVGGAIAACFFCITKMMRDDPGFIWHDFKRKFKENYISAIPVGVFFVLVFYMQIHVLMIFSGGAGADVPLWAPVMNIIVLFVIAMIMPYIFVQLPYICLKPMELLKNSLILSFINMPRSFMAALQGGAILIIYAFFFPYSMVLSPLIAVFAFTLSWLLALMWIWKPVDERFKIEETLAKRKADALHEQMNL